ncbi:MAG: exodeoxyribonuclease V subunit gamma, partial [Syntrophales bacterium]
MKDVKMEIQEGREHGNRERKDGHESGFIVHTGNRLEILVEKLSNFIEKPPSSPFVQEVIVVQSRGMDRWLSMELARRHGICANIHFPFPKHFIQEIFSGMIPGYAEPAVFNQEMMTWTIMKLLPEFFENPDFSDLRRYVFPLREENGESTPSRYIFPDHGLKLLQLSSRVARVFDHYLIHRPAMIHAWERGRVNTKEEAWQAQLWRALSAIGHGRHIAASRHLLHDILLNASPSSDCLPERVSVFGISSMPALYLEIFHDLSQLIPVAFFLMNPSREYWGDVRSEKETGQALRKIREKTGRISLTHEDLHFEEGNALLASMGTTGRTFIHQVAALQEGGTECFTDLSDAGMLHTIQSDILNLRDRKSLNGLKLRVDPADHSIEIHVCHSPMREIEVLHERLLALFDEDRTLLPKDILVMTPDIELYAPFIKAVFDPLHAQDAASDTEREIPYSIADRGVPDEFLSVRTLFAILDLVGSRVSAVEVLSILESDPVRRRFNFMEEDMDLIRHWIAETRIRWGINADHRVNLGLPATRENTWQAGCERLLLGFALPGGGEKLFEGILPFDDIEGNDAIILGRFLTFLDHLFSIISDLMDPRIIDEWADTFIKIYRIFLLSDNDEKSERVEEETTIMAGIRQLRAIAGETGFDESVRLDVAVSFLADFFHTAYSNWGFITGSVTFCTLLPMRSVPFKTVCLSGMNDSAYPRQDRPNSFDLMAKHPIPGDPSRREEDRYLFLEALLSAGEHLIITYTGRSIDDNHVVPPSVLVSELIEYIEEAFEHQEKISPVEHITTVHHLQAFHPDYFRQGNKWFSYDEENCMAARCLLEPCMAPSSFLPSALTEPADEWRTVDLRGVQLFFRNPIRYLLRRRLHINLDEGPDLPDEQESFIVEGLDRYAVDQILVEEIGKGHSPER